LKGPAKAGPFTFSVRQRGNKPFVFGATFRAKRYNSLPYKELQELAPIPFYTSLYRFVKKTDENPGVLESKRGRKAGLVTGIAGFCQCGK
jgi:hypothetical protein